MTCNFFAGPSIKYVCPEGKGWGYSKNVHLLLLWRHSIISIRSPGEEVSENRQTWAYVVYGWSLRWLLNSLDMPRYSSESKKRYIPRLVFMANYVFDQWSLVRFVIKRLFVYLFLVKQCIYLVVKMYFMKIFVHLLWSGNKFASFFVFSNVLLTLHATWTIKESKILKRFKESR